MNNKNQCINYICKKTNMPKFIIKRIFENVIFPKNYYTVNEIYKFLEDIRKKYCKELYNVK